MMKKIVKIRICDWGLLVLTVAVLASGVQLEATDSRSLTTVWVHVAIGLAFVAAVAWHVFLHFGRNNWFARFRKLKSQATRVLWWAYLALVLSGIVACAHRLITFAHSPIGGVHGKVGFLMLVLAIGHIAKRIKFFRKK